MKLVLAFTILCVIYMAGCWVSKLTRGIIPAALVCAVAMLLGFWSGLFPSDIVEVSGLQTVYRIMSALIIVNMGTTLEVRQFRQYQKLTLCVLISCAALGVITMTLDALLVGHELALASFPILMGAIRATQIITDALNARGMNTLSAVIVLLNAVQMFFGLPMVALGSRYASRTMLADRRSGPPAGEKPAPAREACVERIPAMFRNPFFHLAELGVLGTAAAYLAELTSPLTNGIVGMPVLALLLGFAVRQLGLVESNPMQKSGVLPFFLFATILALDGNFSSLTPAAFVASILQVVILLLLGTAALALTSFAMSKVFRMNSGIVVAAAFGAFTGYPLNFQVAQDTIEACTADAEERTYLSERILPCISLGSIISVTITSVIAAGIVAAML